MLLEHRDRFVPATSLESRHLQQNSEVESVMSWTQDTLFSSKKQDWATPPALFDAVNAEFSFGLDACASPHNAKCELFLTSDGLETEWHKLANTVWCNPPYGREVGKWVHKAYVESLSGACCVCLIFARTDTQWWHKWAWRAAEIRLIAGRVTFEGAAASAPAPSCLLIFDEERRSPRVITQVLPRS